MTEPIIRIIDVTKQYSMAGHVVDALKGVSVTIYPGEFVALMGPSGSGKTTFMNIAGCLDRPTAGQYWFEGKDVSGLSRNAQATIRNQRIGFVFQNYSLLARTTALENVELPIVYARRRVRNRRRALDLLELVGLGARAHHYPSQLSGGQQQRVAIARALANNPALILADEPTGDLDSETSCEIMALLQELNRSGVTIVMVTHDLDVANYAARQLHFRDGRLVQPASFRSVLPPVAGRPAA